jgi:hypothetical protein
MRTALALFGWSADTIIALLTLLVFVVLLWHFRKLDEHSKNSAEQAVRLSIKEGVNRASERATNKGN